ncbi:hypothetical protein ACXKTX_02185 [Burkholderia gladioli]
MSTTPSKPYKWFVETMKAATYWYCSQELWSRRGKVIERDVQRAIHDYGKPPDGYAVHMEVPYKRFFPNIDMPDPLTPECELDLAFRRKIKGSKKHTTTIACELKLRSPNRSRFEEDIRRLATIKQQWPRISTYLVVFSVGEKKGYPNENSHYLDHYAPVPGTDSQQYRLVENFTITSSGKEKNFEGKLYIFSIENLSHDGGRISC